jgi:hypothetical protein
MAVRYYAPYQNDGNVWGIIAPIGVAVTADAVDEIDYVDSDNITHN